MTRNRLPEEAHFIANFLAKFTNSYELLNIGNQTQTHNHISLLLNIKSFSIRRLRDEYDGFYSNGRTGYPDVINRKLRVEYRNKFNAIPEKEYLMKINNLLKSLSIYKRNPQKIARICWNYYNWTKPSGKEGKSSNKKNYEFKTKFGYEEWLFDFDKQTNGFHYAFLQPINAHRKSYIGKTFDIDLYSFNDDTKEYWWLGKIKNVEIISYKEGNEIYDIYQKKGWIKEMSEQLKIVDADYKTFESEKNIFNIKFKISDTDELLDIPLKIKSNDTSIPAKYYTTLLNKTNEPDLYNTNAFNFIPKHNPQKRNSVIEYGQRLSEIDRLHPKIQDFCYEQLKEEFGPDKVGTEISTGYGGSIDLVVQNKKGDYIFYEIKTNKSIRKCIREALSQLLEYAHFPNENNASKFIIISQNPITENVKEYLKNIRIKYQIPVYYKQFDLTQNKLLNDEN